MISRRDVRLGRIASGPTPHLPALADYLPLFLPNGEGIDWGRNVASWPMAMNDRLGCCTISGLVHLVQVWGAYDGYGHERIATDVEVVAGYHDLAGYDGTPATDRGAMMADVLAGWLRDGMMIGGERNKPAAFARIDPKNLDHVRLALAEFGPLYIGIALPLSAQIQPVWTAPASLVGDSAPGSWGGHCVLLTALTGQYATFITWGAEQRAEIGWWLDYVDECWAVLSGEWSMSGQSYAQLVADMARVA